MPTGPWWRLFLNWSFSFRIIVACVKLTKITRITVICSLYSENYDGKMIRKQLGDSYTISTVQITSIPSSKLFTKKEQMHLLWPGLRNLLPSVLGWVWLWKKWLVTTSGENREKWCRDFSTVIGLWFRDWAPTGVEEAGKAAAGGPGAYHVLFTCPCPYWASSVSPFTGLNLRSLLLSV